jgi:hypothetical protein
MKLNFFYLLLTIGATNCQTIQQVIQTIPNHTIPINGTTICDIGSPNGDCTVTKNHKVYCSILQYPLAKKNPYWNVCSPEPIHIHGNLIFKGNGSLTCEAYGTGPEQIKKFNLIKETSCKILTARKVPSLCELRLNVDKSMKMEDASTIISSSLLLNVTGTFEMDTKTLINASSLGVPSLPYFSIGGKCKPPGQPPEKAQTAYPSYGASHAGSGGIGGDVGDVPNTVIIPYTALSDGNSNGRIIGNVSYFPFNTTDFEWGYSGVVGFNDQNSAGRGGGRIKITSKQPMTINGQILARGGDASSNNPRNDYVQCCGGGSGGTILLSSNEILGNGIISASGGQSKLVTLGTAHYLRGGGGGGRVLLNFTEAQPGGDVTLMIDTNGGSLDDTSKIGMSMASYGQGAPGTIVKNVFGYSAELDVWGPPPSTSQGSKMLAITPVVINSQERISVFNIGNGQKLYANVVSNQIRMCDEEQYCTIQKSSQSIAGLSINILGTLQFKIYSSSNRNGNGKSNWKKSNNNNNNNNNVIGFIYSIQAHALNVDGCLEYDDTTIMDVQVGDGGFAVTKPGRLSFGGGTVRVTSHGKIDISGDMGSDAARCLSTNIESTEKRRQQRRRQVLSSSQVTSDTYSITTRLELRSIYDLSIGNTNNEADITVDSLTLLSLGNILIGAAGSIDPGSATTQCLRDVIGRQPCKNILLPSKTTTSNLDSLPWPKTNFTVVIGVTGNGYIGSLTQSSIKGDRILLCSDNGTISIDGTLDASGQGCGAGTSTDDRGDSPFLHGGGFCLEHNYGGGGAHYGSGGQGCVPPSSISAFDHELRLMKYGIKPICPDKRKVYGGLSNNVEQDEPLMSGAGGGCASPQGGNGNGGGVVVIHGKKLCLGTNNCQNGNNQAKLLATGNPGANGGGGGGGGGSISIEVDEVESSISSILSVKGGDGNLGNLGGGGGGGGGRLYVAVNPVHPNSTGGPFLNFHADVSVSGGNGSYFNGSGYGGDLSSDSCPLHYELAPLFNAHKDPTSDKYTKNKLACTLCAKGYYQEVKGEQCKSCLPGYFQNLTGQSTCIPCHNNSYCLKNGCTSCNICETGNYTNSSTHSCQQCPICNDQHSRPQINNILCRPLKHAYFCTPLTKDHSNRVICQDQNILPSMRLVTPSSSPIGPAPIPLVGSTACLYHCKPGYIQPRCITPFAMFLEDIGGLLVFVLGVAVTAVLFGVVFGVVCKRVEGCSVYQQRQKFIRLEGLQRMPGSPYQNKNGTIGGGAHSNLYSSEHMSDGGMNIGGRSGSESIDFMNTLDSPHHKYNSGSFDHRVPRLAIADDLHKIRSSSLGVTEGNSPLLGRMSRNELSRSRGGGGKNSNKNKKNKIPWYVICPRLGLQDLSVHAYRLIPDGTNSPISPWRIPLSCSDSGIAPLVIPERYESFAKALNSAVEWNQNGWETWCYWLLLGLWYPLAAEFLSWRRNVRAGRLVELVRDEEGQSAHHQMLSGHRARVLHNCLRLNISDDCTMFWLDVLYRETTPAPTQMYRSVGAPRLPMLLCLSGDGTSRDPLHLDLNDVLINSIPQLTVLSDFIDNRWVDFVLSLNEALRCVDCDHLSITIGSVLRLIDKSNEEDYLNGLHLQIVLMWPNSKLVTNAGTISGREMPAKYEVEKTEARLAIHIAMGRKRCHSRFGIGNDSSGNTAVTTTATATSTIDNSNNVTTSPSSIPPNSVSSPPGSRHLSPSMAGSLSSVTASMGLLDLKDDVNNKTWKLAGKRRNNSNRLSAEDMFNKETPCNTAELNNNDKRSMSIRDRMLGSGGDVSTSTSSKPNSVGKFTAPVSPNTSNYYQPPLSPSIRRFPSNSGSMTTVSSRRYSGMTTLTKPDAIDFNEDDEDEEDIYNTQQQQQQQQQQQTPSPDSSDPDDSVVLPSDLPLQSRSLTAYHEDSLNHNRNDPMKVSIFVSDDFVSLDYSAIQTINSAKRQACSRDKCIFLFVVIITLTSFLSTLTLFIYSEINTSILENKDFQNLDYRAGQIFLIFSLILVLSHVVLSRSFQLKLCSSHVTNVLTRNR